jgi:hypothetical protein
VGRQIIAKNDSRCLLPVVVEPYTPVLTTGFGWVWVGLGRSYGFWVGLGWYFRERSFTWVPMGLMFSEIPVSGTQPLFIVFYKIHAVVTLATGTFVRRIP